MIRHINPTDESKDISWVTTEALPTLAYLAYCKNRFKCKPDLSDKSRTLFRNRLASAFAHLMPHPRSFFYPCELLLDDNFTPDAIPMDEHILEVSNQARGIIKKLCKKAKKSLDAEKRSLESLSLLYALVIFQLYNGEADAVNLLDELKLYYDSLTQKKDAASPGTEASVILVEVLLSLISRPSALFRKVAEQVFTAFCSELTEEGIKLMTDVLESTENLKGQQELFDQDEQNGEGDDGNIDGLDSEVEPGESEQDEEDEGDPEDGKDEKEGNDEELLKLDIALAEALGTHPAHQDINAESSHSDADMTDSEIIALDTKLVEIFSQRKKAPNKKKESKNARENIINFKNRVLDLLDVYVKKQARNPLSYNLLLPLLQLIRTTTSKQTSERAHSVISTFAKASRGAAIEGEHANIDKSKRLQLLEEIHAEASKDLAHAFARAASAASLLVASSLHKTSKNYVKKIASVYRDTQVAWLQGRVNMQASFFHDWVNWCQSHAAAS
jgi:DNA polymerase phi